MKLTLAAMVALMLAALPVPAHHSFAAEYDATKPIKLTNFNGRRSILAAAATGNEGG